MKITLNPNPNPVPDIERAVAADLLTRGDAKRSTVEIGNALAAGASGAK